MAAADEATTKLYTDILVSNGVTSKIKQVLVKIPELAGDQFASQCKFVTVTFEDDSVKPIELFVKVPVNNPEYAVILKLQAAFEREAGFFNSILPDLKRFAAKQPGYDGFLEDVFPKCYYSSDELIVLENVVKAGFTMLDKHVPHDLKTTIMVLENVAKFQAASFAYIQHIGLPAFEAKYSYVNKMSIWDERNTFITPWVNTPIYGAIKILSECPLPGSEKALEYFKSIEHSGPKLVAEKIIQGTQLCSKVLTHADLWNGNVMFTKSPETQEIEKCLLIDLQTILLGTPAFDIVLYCLMSVDHSLMHAQWKDLLQIFYRNFSNAANSLGQRVQFTLEDLVKDFQDRSPVGFIFAMYPAFGFEAIDAVGDLGNAEGDPNLHFMKAANAAIEKKMQEKGEKLSGKILKAFNLFQDILLGVQLKQ